jgi:apolipoprotein N-acyltransferase
MLAVLLLALPLVAGAPGWLALGGLASLVLVARQASPRTALAAGWATGAAVWAVSTDWLTHALGTMGGASPVTAWALHLLHALWCGLPLGVLACCLAWPGCYRSVLRRLAVAVAGGLWLTHFPQPVPAPVTTGLAMDPRLLQWAAPGAWALSAVALWLAIAWTDARTGAERVRVLLWVALVMLVGHWRLDPAGSAASALTDAVAVPAGSVREPVPAARALRIAVLQPSLPPDTEDTASRTALQQLVQSSRALLARPDTRADLLVWPEVPIALSLSDRDSDRDALQGLTRDTGVPLLVNGYAHLDPDGQRYSNTSWLLLPDGTHQRYDKQVLVPFGEYLPAAFSGLASFLPGVKRYAPGQQDAPLVRGTLRIGTPVCFEALMPDRLRALKEAGATMFINQGDDLWFQSARAQRLHLAVARLRAVETGMPMLRVFNSGITVLIDARGRLSRQYGEVDGLFEAVYEVPLPDAGTN